MQIIDKLINDIKPYERNPRKNDHAITPVAESIKQFGFKVPIVIDGNNTIVCGHTRWKAARQLGLKNVPCVVADDLTDEQIKAFRLADNKVSEIATWDNNGLTYELDAITNIDMSLFGFDTELNNIDDNEIEPEVPFTEILREEHNYVVLYFDNEVDWVNAQTILQLQTVQNPSTRNDGKITKSFSKMGIGRVLKGSEALRRIRGEN